jgi:hypothetical protein
METASGFNIRVNEGTQPLTLCDSNLISCVLCACGRSRQQHAYEQGRPSDSK